MTDWRNLHFVNGRFNYESSPLPNDRAQDALKFHRSAEGWWRVDVETERFCVLVNRENPTRMEIWVREDLLK